MKIDNTKQFLDLTMAEALHIFDTYYDSLDNAGSYFYEFGEWCQNMYATRVKCITQDGDEILVILEGVK